MLAFLPAPLLLLLSLLLTVLNTAFHSLFILVGSLLKLLLPFPPVSRILSRLNHGFMGLWLAGNSLLLKLINRVDWQIEDHSHLDPQGWHLIICNHLSWTDIVILGHLFRGRLPVPKFFVKYELLYVPFVGLACWGLDMPFMRRYSRDMLIKQPHLRGKDVQTTQAACAKFRHVPTTVINFVEGTRFRPEKHRARRSPYQHLLPPKAAGLAMALSAMEGQFEKIVNITLAYPDNRRAPFLDLLRGRMGRIQVHIEEIPVTAELCGDYVNDKHFKQQFQAWLNQRWRTKDERLASWIAQDPPSTDAGITLPRA